MGDRKTAQEVAEQLCKKLMNAEFYEQKKNAAWGGVYALTTELHETMEEQGVDKIDIDGLEFKPIQERSFSLNMGDDKMTFDNYDPFFAWLKTNKLDGIIKTKLSVHHATRKSTLSEFVDKGNVLPEFIAEKFLPTVKWSKAAVTRKVKEIQDAKAGKA